jgi:hypothetical protein
VAVCFAAGVCVLFFVVVVVVGVGEISVFFLLCIVVGCWSNKQETEDRCSAAAAVVVDVTA